jgi:hypothetical protein
MKEESKNDRFKRIATRRTNEILQKIRVLGNCANRSSYEYSEDEVEKIFSEINKQLKITKTKFLDGRQEFFQL